MRWDHSRSGGTAPAHDAVGTDGRDDSDDPDGVNRIDGRDRLGRRSFLRGTAGAGAAAVGVGTVGTARAQDGTGTADGEAERATTSAAFAEDAPRLGNSDYTGLFVHVAGVNQDASTRDVSTCPFVESDDAVVAYDVTVVDRASEETPQADTLLFAAVDDDSVAFGKLFIVTGQTDCGSDHVQAQLEEVGAATFDTADVDIGGPDVTETDSPGFGVAGALAGVLGTGELLRRRR
ncbi:PGF-CTERM sorting domain-containing protein [Halorarum halobium]|uniref:PGF-CTERM sorting domain-containing protein n=1 Tax=Halorarum halobium TaxID=3075121 RepID=UPI0028AF8A95|nr:PGF-CTERM sorting domain-containing protein [Halobaculum sp. XH14]